MKRIGLSGQKSAIIGSAGLVKITGSDVKPAHAEIKAARIGGESRAMLRPLNGPVTVLRHGRAQQVRAEWVLMEGDIVVIGKWRLTYKNSGLDEEQLHKRGRAVQWAS